MSCIMPGKILSDGVSPSSSFQVVDRADLPIFCGRWRTGVFFPPGAAEGGRAISALIRARLDKRWDVFETLVRVVRKNAPSWDAAAKELAAKELDKMLETAISGDGNSSQERDALIAGGCDVDATVYWTRTQRDRFNQRRFCAASLLSWAVENGWKNSVAALLNGGANPNKRGNFVLGIPSSPPALFLAVEAGDLELVELLCKKRADVSAENEEKMSPLVGAVSAGDVGMVRLLLHYGAQDGTFSALYIATTLSNNTLRQLIKTAPAANAQNPEALRHDLMTALLDAGISTDKVSNSNTKPHRTALFAAAHRGDLATVNLLVRRGAVYPFGHVPGTTTDATPLTAAVQGGHLEVVKALLDAGESVSVRCATRMVRTFYGGDGLDDLQWLTPLQLAVLDPPEMRWKSDCVKLLLSARADVDPPPFIPVSSEFAVEDPMFLKKPAAKRLSPVLLAAILPSDFITCSIPTMTNWQEQQLDVFRTLWQHGSQPFGHADSLYRTAAEFFAALVQHTSMLPLAEKQLLLGRHFQHWQQLVRVAFETGGMAPSDLQALFLRLTQLLGVADPQGAVNRSLRLHKRCMCALRALLELSQSLSEDSMVGDSTTLLDEDTTSSAIPKMIDTGAALRHCARFGKVDAVQMLFELKKFGVDLDSAKMLASCDSGGRSALHEVGNRTDHGMVKRNHSSQTQCSLGLASSSHHVSISRSRSHARRGSEFRTETAEQSLLCTVKIV